jgi:hypothetical protein
LEEVVVLASCYQEPFDESEFAANVAFCASEFIYSALKKPFQWM